MFELDLERRKIEIRKKAQNPENPKTLSARPSSQRPSSLGPSARPSARLTGPAPPRPVSLSTARFVSRLAPLRTAHPAQASSPSAQVAPHRLTARPHQPAPALSRALPPPRRCQPGPPVSSVPSASAQRSNGCPVISAVTPPGLARRNPRGPL